MIRVSRNQLDQLRAVCGELKINAAKHGVYIEASKEEAANYRRILTGNLSKRQKSTLYWYYKKRHKAQEKPKDAA